MDAPNWIVSAYLPPSMERLGFDEIAVRKGQRYLTVVVDHDTGKLVWAHPGRDRKTVEKFLDSIGKERCAQTSRRISSSASLAALTI